MLSCAFWGLWFTILFFSDKTERRKSAKFEKLASSLNIPCYNEQLSQAGYFNWNRTTLTLNNMFKALNLKWVMSHNFPYRHWFVGSFLWNLSESSMHSFCFYLFIHLFNCLTNIHWATTKWKTAISTEETIMNNNKVENVKRRE